MSQSPAEGFGPLSYQVTLPLSRQTLQLVAELIRTHRSRLRSRWRKADPRREQVVLTPYKAEARRPLSKAQKQANAAFSAMRCAVEGGFAALKHWHILDRLRLNTRHATTLLQALLVLTQHEQNIRDSVRPGLG
ncbi:transposase family protein [Amycolatopsis sp. OK19-0408]|uniref:Transposase family protein n=1 Tax=Amycolatopsis iheyensis TaxID=2945988 RepID=A0A9X2SRS6_9PSEU|nr:transposase family protein [Amycolatopsis iheyensis]MCR6490690.1 transposase family protein [Amycolatopsis iheyensis]